MPLKPSKGIYALCPRCGARRMLDDVPVAPWPLCLECDELMNVFVPRGVADRVLDLHRPQAVAA